MYVIRPVKESDLDVIEELAHTVSLGVISLSRNRSVLQSKIQNSLNSFKQEITSPGNELYFFVLEDTKTQSPLGTCAIKAKMGAEDPRYYFQIETQKPKSEILPLPKELRTLHAVSEIDGPSELCSLFLIKELRKEGLGELLSHSRFLFMSQFPGRVDPTIVANLRGVINPDTNRSPFWDGWGKHFLDMEFEETAEFLENEIDIAKEFLPKYPIYVSFLPNDAQKVIGKTHVSTEAAFTILQKEGFSPNNNIDLFDGGPFVSCPLTSIRTVKESLTATAEIAPERNGSPICLIANTRPDFRVCYGKLQINEGGFATISQETADALRINSGDTLRYIPSVQFQEGS